MKADKPIYRYEPPFPGHRIKIAHGLYVRQGECLELTEAEASALCPDFLHRVDARGARLDTKVLPPAPVVLVTPPPPEVESDDNDESEPEAPKKRRGRKPRR